jgi:hypothetical protein
MTAFTQTRRLGSHMEAREWLNQAKTDGDVITVQRYDEAGEAAGRGPALVIDDDRTIAVLLQPLGPFESRWPGGTLVGFREHEGEARIVGSPAHIDPSLARV